MVNTRTAFDPHAASYDRLWTNAPAGRLQREAVWRNLAPFVPANGDALDLGCGTGEDALWLQSAGVRVTAIDSSPAMVATARSRGVEARVHAIEDLDRLSGAFDFALSNFGPLNCVRDLTGLRSALARKIRPGGHLAICLMGRFCAWETLAYGMKGEFRKAVRRWSGRARAESLGIDVTYPTVRELCGAFAPDFRCLRAAGIGIAVPPSFVGPLPAPLLAVCGAADRMIERNPLATMLADHRLLIFVRK